MAREIEILWEVAEPLESALAKLSHLHAHGVKETIDTYYTHEKLTRLQPDKNGRVVEWFRIRENEERTFLTHKKDRFNAGGVWTHSDEEETRVDDAQRMREIIVALGFTELVRIDNRKHTFTTDTYEVVLEDVEDLGLFLEVEVKRPGEDVEEERERIRAFIAKLGILGREERDAGKPELLLRKRRA